MSATIKTARGVYAIKIAVPIDRADDFSVVTLGLERADGIEKIALKVRVANSLMKSAQIDTPEKIVERLAPWLEREFEQTREAALKGIRVERRLFEISFDASHPGPFFNPAGRA
ncbi:MAG TPA: hypothetical protein VEU51_04995 [Candidatus Acidoferrales bacterium]|nr:hypothetical protein [Candidatus Acidoferrales bacterium]